MNRSVQNEAGHPDHVGSDGSLVVLASHILPSSARGNDEIYPHAGTSEAMRIDKYDILFAHDLAPAPVEEDGSYSEETVSLVDYAYGSPAPAQYFSGSSGTPRARGVFSCFDSMWIHQPVVPVAIAGESFNPVYSNANAQISVWFSVITLVRNGPYISQYNDILIALPPGLFEDNNMLRDAMDADGRLKGVIIPLRKVCNPRFWPESVEREHMKWTEKLPLLGTNTSEEKLDNDYLSLLQNISGSGPVSWDIIKKDVKICNQGMGIYLATYVQSLGLPHVDYCATKMIGMLMSEDTITIDPVFAEMIALAMFDMVRYTVKYPFKEDLQTHLSALRVVADTILIVCKILYVNTCQLVMQARLTAHFAKYSHLMTYGRFSFFRRFVCGRAMENADKWQKMKIQFGKVL